jgi:hypothetical protein
MITSFLLSLFIFSATPYASMRYFGHFMARFYEVFFSIVFSRFVRLHRLTFGVYRAEGTYPYLFRILTGIPLLQPTLTAPTNLPGLN